MESSLSWHEVCLTSGIALLYGPGLSVTIKVKMKGESRSGLRCGCYTCHLGHSSTDISQQVQFRFLRYFFLHRQIKNTPQIATSNIYIVPALPPFDNVSTTLLGRKSGQHTDIAIHKGRVGYGGLAS